MSSASAQTPLCRKFNFLRQKSGLPCITQCTPWHLNVDPYNLGVILDIRYAELIVFSGLHLVQKNSTRLLSLLCALQQKIRERNVCESCAGKCLLCSCVTKIYSENDRYDQVELRYRLIIMKKNIKYACKERNLPDLIEK